MIAPKPEAQPEEAGAVRITLRPHLAGVALQVSLQAEPVITNENRSNTRYFEARRDYFMKLPTDRPITVRFVDGKELTVTVHESDQLGILVESAEGQARTIVIPWSAINQVTWQ
jgi:hypothetical protein